MCVPIVIPTESQRLTSSEACLTSGMWQISKQGHQAHHQVLIQMYHISDTLSVAHGYHQTISSNAAVEAATVCQHDDI
jgi:hypothetical protein